MLFVLILEINFKSLGIEHSGNNCDGCLFVFDIVFNMKFCNNIHYTPQKVKKTRKECKSKKESQRSLAADNFLLHRIVDEDNTLLYSL